MNNYLFGKLPKKDDDRNLKFATYSKELAPPPESFDNLSTIYTKLGISDPKKLFPMDGNDVYGDCVMAGIAHMITGWNGLIGKKKIPSTTAVVRQYKKQTGGVDTGLSELDTLKYWNKHSFFCEKILAFVESDPKNHVHTMQSIERFKGIYVGMNVQQNAIADFDAGRMWTPGKLTGHGHCVVIVGYDKDTVTILTWGGLIKATWSWVDCCVDESYPILPVESKSPEFAPGFDFKTLQSDLIAVQNK